MKLEETSTCSNYSVQELERIILDAKVQLKEFRMAHLEPAFLQGNKYFQYLKQRLIELSNEAHSKILGLKV